MISPEDLAWSLEYYCYYCPSNGDCPQYCEKLAEYKRKLIANSEVVDE